MTQQQPEPTQVDAGAVLHHLGQQIAQQAVTIAGLSVQLEKLREENALLHAQNEVLAAAQEAHQQAGAQ